MAETPEVEGIYQHAPEPVADTIEAELWRFYEAEEYERSLEACDILLEMRPKSARFWALKGHLHRELMQYGDALRSGQKAVELDESDPDALLEMGLTFLEVGKTVEGVELIRVVFEQNRDKSKPPEEQSLHVIKAGAILEGIQKGIEHIREEQAKQPKE